jgi:hypothetical protein
LGGFVKFSGAFDAVHIRLVHFRDRGRGGGNRAVDKTLFFLALGVNL